VQTVEALTHTLVVHRHAALDLDACVDEVVTLVTAYLASGAGGRSRRSVNATPARPPGRSRSA
jgi:hypothetical protein